MTAEYVCPGCGYTFRSDAPGGTDCPACGTEASKLWRVPLRDVERPAVAEGQAAAVPPAAAVDRPAAAPPVEPAPIRRPTEPPRPRRSSRRRPPWSFRVPGRALSALSWPNRWTLVLAAILALWPFPLDDDRLPYLGPAVSTRSSPPSGPAEPATTAATLNHAHPSGASAPAPPRSPKTQAGPVASVPEPTAGPDTGEIATPVPPDGADPVGATRAEAVGASGRLAGATGELPGKPGVPPAPGTAAVAGAAAEPAACLRPDDRRLVFLIDVSVSMGLPYQITLAEEDALDAATDRGDQQALARYRALLDDTGPSRLDVSRNAFGAALDLVPAGVDVGVVAFLDCNDIHRFEPVGRSDHDALRSRVATLAWRRGGDTALSAGLAAAYRMMGGRRGRIVVISDGKDTCGPPPCSAIAGLAAGNPGVRVDVVDVAGRSGEACLASATGGTFTVAPLSGPLDAFVDAVGRSGRACSPEAPVIR